jgi:hypothetical protein
MPALNFPLPQQECTEWCWAAVGSAVTACYQDDPPLNQRQVVGKVLGGGASNCNCQQDPTLPCNRPQNLAFVLDRANQHGGDSAASMEFSEVKDEIDQNRPIVVQVALAEPAASGHAIAIYGYGDDGTVLLADPMRAGDTISVAFEDLLRGSDANYHARWQKAYKTLPR